MTDRPGGHEVVTGGAAGLTHERARRLLAERLYEPLDPETSEWLDGHLTECQDCRLADTEYRASRDALRALMPPIPPRDLWARTSAALDREERHVRRPWSIPTARLARLSRARGPMGAAIAVVVVVAFVASSALLQGTVPKVGSASTAPRTSTASNARATPIAVGAGDVVWFTTAGDGSSMINRSNVDQVCPATAATPCATLLSTAADVPLAVAPQSVYGSPARDQVVVLGRKVGSTALTMFVMSVAGTPKPKPTPTRQPAATATPLVSAHTGPSSGPTVSPTPTSSTPLSSPTPGSGSTPTPPVSPPTPESPGSSAGTSPSIVPGETPTPTAAAVLAIASGLVVVGQTAAYSPDGTWFAFNARGPEAVTGSDIYVWRAGELTAVPVTTDGRSVFSGWFGDRLIGSRVPVGDTASPDASASAGSSAPIGTGAASTDPTPSAAATAPAVPSDLTVSSFLLDPATGSVATLAAPVWRPVVDPSGRLVVFWAGSVVADPVTGGWMDATGSLVVGSWPAIAGAALTAPPVLPSPAGSASPGDSPASSPSPSPSPSASTSPAAPPASSVDATSPGAGSSSTASASNQPTSGPVGLPVEVGSASGLAWDAAWDGTGEHLAVWIGDPADAAGGHISLLSIDPATGQPQSNGPSLLAAPALPGFSLSDGHLAWATPADASGSGSRLQVFAWSGPDAGKIDSQPAGATDTVIVVQH